MKSLYNYLIFEGSATENTKIQETLSCVFFDGYFNSGAPFTSTDDLMKYYSDNTSLIEEIAAAAHLDIDKYNSFIAAKNQRGTQYTKSCLDWQKSFLYQCESLRKWISQHRSFNEELIFIHHDTKIGIHNGQIEQGWGIVERVNGGSKKYHYPNKDAYQKADIYMVSAKLNPNPEGDINDEISYWIRSLEGKTSEKFIGISLKKLNRPLQNIPEVGVNQKTFTVDPSTIKCDIPIFDDVVFKDPSDITPGKLTAKIIFDLDDGDHSSTYNINIRSSRCGPNHHDKDPHVSYRMTTTVELKEENGVANKGKLTNLIKQWNNNEVLNDVKGKNWNDYKVKIDTIIKNFSKHKIPVTINPTNQAKDLIDFLAKNYEEIDKIYTDFEKTGEKPGKSTDDSTIKPESLDLLTLYNITKWYNVSWTILNIFEIISNKMDDPSKTIIDMYKYGIGESSDTDLRLPYVLLGR